MENTERLVIFLLRTALFDEVSDRSFFSNISKENWSLAHKKLAVQGLAALSFEGIKNLPKDFAPPKEILLQWYSQQLSQIKHFNLQRSAIDELAELWESAGIQVKELKGNNIGRLYPNPELRYSCDFDCLLSDYEFGNQIVENNGVKVDRRFYKNASFNWKGVYVENHQFCTPVRGNREMKKFELALRNNMDNANFNALFLMEHMWAHFFEDALGLKQLMDWVVFRSKCWAEVDEDLLETEAKACGFYRFAQSINKIADTFLDGNLEMAFEDRYTQRLWEQIYSGGGSVQMNNGWKTRFQLVFNFFQNSWRYRAFNNHSALYVLVRTATGFLFDRNPKIS